MSDIEEVPINTIPLTEEQKKERAQWAKEKPEREKAEATEARRQGYVRISDPVFFQWQRGEKTEQDWKDAIAEVEKLYPIPGEETA